MGSQRTPHTRWLLICPIFLAWWRAERSRIQPAPIRSRRPAASLPICAEHAPGLLPREPQSERRSISTSAARDEAARRDPSRPRVLAAVAVGTAAA